MPIAFNRNPRLAGLGYGLSPLQEAYMATALYITAPDTPTVLRSGAYATAGTSGADVQIQAAIDAIRTGTGGGSGEGVVFLAPGTFNIANPIKLYSGIQLIGSGMAATQVKLEAGADCDMVQHFGIYTITGTASAGGANTLTDSTKSWATNALAGLHLYIYTGAGAGQRRVITSNTGTVITVPAWAVQPDNTSRYRITRSMQLFMKVEGMTLYGNQDVNPATTGTATSGTICTLTVADAGWTVDQWADRLTIELTGGTSAGDIRRILSNTADTITVDGPFTLAPDGTTTFHVGGSGIAMYGPSAYDLMLTDVWTDACAQHGVYAEETWGHVYKNLISEFNGLDGLRVTLNPFHRGTTGAWPATTGVIPTEGPKMTLCKLVANGRHGMAVGEYIYDSQIVGCELSGGESAYGLYVMGTATGQVMSGCRMVSGHASAAGGVYIGAGYCAITGNYYRGGGYGVRLGTSSNIVAGNSINMTSGTAISDTDGRNVIGSNQSITTVFRDRVRGRKSLVKGSGDYVTLNPQLGAAGHRAGCQIVPLITPADAQTEAAGTWSVAGYPEPTVTAVQINCDTALTAATTSAEAVPSAGAHTITLTSGSGLAVGGYVRFAAAGGGSVEEDVLITAISGADITATFAYVHDSGVAVTPLWTFYYDVGYNDRGTTAA